jgi:hypothetical protein
MSLARQVVNRKGSPAVGMLRSTASFSLDEASLDPFRLHNSCELISNQLGVPPSVETIRKGTLAVQWATSSFAYGAPGRR